MESRQYMLFRLEDIKQATNNFAQENIIEKVNHWIVYKGELSGKKLAFVLVNKRYMLNIRHVVALSSLPEHQNIVSLIGVCVEDRERILVLEHLTRGGLDKHVTGAHLTLLMRLKICLDIAYGLHYLQNHPKKREMYTEYMSSASIHLDENWQAKIQFIAPNALKYPPRVSFGPGQFCWKT